MSKTFFTPGPTQLHPKVKEYIKTALDSNLLSISHRSSKFDDLFANCAQSVRKLLGAPDKMPLFFLSSGTEAMERIIQNMAAKNTFHLVNGAFSERFYQTAKELGKNAQVLQAESGQGFNFGLINVPDNTELICCTHNETSTGVMLRKEDLESLKSLNPDKFIALDVVSSAPYCELDFKHIDATFFSVQKLFGLPAGLGVLLVSEAAISKSLQLMSAGTSIGTYHNFPTLISFAKKFQTPATPNVLGIYLLSKIAEEYLNIGIDQIRQDTITKARYIYNFFEQHQQFKPFVDDRRFRSATVITLNFKGEIKKLKTLLDKHNFEVGSGYGEFKDKQIRIANFPMHSLEQVKELCTVLDSYPAKS